MIDEAPLARARRMYAELAIPPDGGLAGLRAAYEAFCRQFPVPADARVEEIEAGGVPALEITVPESSLGRTLLYLHGGGYAIGTAAGFAETAAHLARTAAARVVVPDYRLAPEHPFPAALDDARAALASLVELDRVVVAGDSAGAGLSLAACVARRDAGEPLPAGVVCISPWTDLECGGASMQANAALDPVIQRDGLRGMAAVYLRGADPHHPLAAPAHADLRGLPPLLVLVGGGEALLDDGLAIAEHARAGGVRVELHVEDAMPHCWTRFASFLPEGEAAVRRIGAFVRRLVP